MLAGDRRAHVGGRVAGIADGQLGERLGEDGDDLVVTVDLDRIVETLVPGVTGNNGESCTNPTSPTPSWAERCVEERGVRPCSRVGNHQVAGP
ncbi:hypothetical protein [Streptomyces sp. NPDC051642]|uniref:hypothetical protein n=1 Tax=unclassified Streptomyces TaxID=2593676 RepID=UPI0034364C95